MKVVFNPSLKAKLTLNEAGRVTYIDHSQQYYLSNQSTPLLVADDYLKQIADLLQIEPSQLSSLSQTISSMEPMERGVEYHLSDQRQQFDSTTISFVQTHLNIPVWEAGVTVTLKHNPYRVISSVNTSQKGFDAHLPTPAVSERYRKLFQTAEIDHHKRRLGIQDDADPQTINFVHSLVDRNQLEEFSSSSFQDDTRLLQGQFYIYKYTANNRLDHNRELTTPTAPSESPVLPLVPVPESIQEGHYYVVAKVIFSYTVQNAPLNWLALVELETGSVLYLRALFTYDQNPPVSVDDRESTYDPISWAGGITSDITSTYDPISFVGVTGMVFTIDPISATGDDTLTANQSNEVLNEFRTSVPLFNLDAPVDGVQSLRGRFAHVTNVQDPNIAPPTQSYDPSISTRFDYDVRTNDFAAVNAYYHVDRFFKELERLGFNISEYFDNTTFPIRIDHRSCSNACPTGFEIGAHARSTTSSNPSGKANGLDIDFIGYMLNIDHIGYMLNDLGDITNPIGRACDSRVTWHELGGHGVLYQHIGSGRFKFCHSAGDSLSLIFHDPTSQAPDRFRYAPWNPIVFRRCDRPVPDWAWGSTNDDKNYGSEEILATTLFRVYRSIGGDSTDLPRRQFASRMMIYLILTAIGTLTSGTNPTDAAGFLAALETADQENWTAHGFYGGAYKKVFAWSFAEQGLSTAVLSIDVYIEDGRGGGYTYQAVHWDNASIWNRRQPDGEIKHEEPALGVVNYAYVRIKNRGAQTAKNVKVRGYHCKPLVGAVWPQDFKPMITLERSVDNLLGNNADDRVVGPFLWQPAPNAWGHDCLLMVVSADTDEPNGNNLTPNEFLEDWRLVPNDNNIGQRNVVLVPGGGGKKGLMAGLDQASFWISNPTSRTTTIRLQAQLPQFLVDAGWHLSFKNIVDDQFKLAPGKEKKISVELHPGDNFTRQQAQQAKDQDINVSVFANDMLIGGMIYRIDPDIKQPFNSDIKESEKFKPHVNFLGRILQWAWIISAGGILIAPGGVHCTICDAIGLGDFGDTVINVLGIGLIAFGVRGLASSFLQARSQPVLNEQAINQQGL